MVYISRQHPRRPPAGGVPPEHFRDAAEHPKELTAALLFGGPAKLDELGKRIREGPGGAYLQAYERGSGKLLAQVEVERSLHSSPITYLHEGRQYIVVAAGGVSEKAELVAFALPQIAAGGR